MTSDDIIALFPKSNITESPYELLKKTLSGIQEACNMWETIKEDQLGLDNIANDRINKRLSFLKQQEADYIAAIEKFEYPI
jgi:hypothetical protein